MHDTSFINFNPDWIVPLFMVIGAVIEIKLWELTRTPSRLRGVSIVTIVSGLFATVLLADLAKTKITKETLDSTIAQWIMMNAFYAFFAAGVGAMLVFAFRWLFNKEPPDVKVEKIIQTHVAEIKKETAIDDEIQKILDDNARR